MTDDTSCRSCGTDGGEDREDGSVQDQNALAGRLAGIRHTILVLSGKGGVGKSTVAANLALSLALSGRKVGLLDVDIHGPSVPRVLGLDDVQVRGDGESIFPTTLGDNLKVMSVGFLLKNRQDAVVWRGPLKFGAITQFIRDVAWGDLDFLVVDCPPGTGDEPLSVAQLIPDLDGVLIVTTPQQMAIEDVRKSVNFCHALNLPVLGVIENMSGFACPHCGGEVNLFKHGGGESMATEMGIPFVGRIPFDPRIVEACDDGEPFIYHQSESAAARAFERVVETVVAVEDRKPGAKPAETPVPPHPPAATEGLRVAVPLHEGKLSPHFGHCRDFALLDVNQATREILGTEVIPAPEHEPGLLPAWLAERGVGLVIAGGMGSRAQGLFNERGITVVVGAPVAPPETVVGDYLGGTLTTGANVCDH